MRKAIDETQRRREIQMAYNKKHHITPTTINKEIRNIIEATQVAEKAPEYIVDTGEMTEKQRASTIKQLEKAMQQAAKDLQFEKAAQIRDELLRLKQEQ